MANKVDLVLFGATGFTGLHCIPYLHKLTKENGRNLTWAVSGRSKSKLEQILKDMGEKIEADLGSTPVIVADTNDYDSLLEMARQAKVVISCCGPYSLLGEGVVKACIEGGAHYVDVSGEPEFMEKMQLEYHEQAVKKGVYAVSACGHDSIPSDLGVVYLEQQFEGTLNSVELYMKTWTEGSVKGSVLNYGTWHTMVESLSNVKSLQEVRDKLCNKKGPKFEPRLALRKLPHKPKDETLKGWAVPFPGADASVIRRTQRYLYEEENRRPVQASVYFLLPNLLYVLGMAVFAVIFTFLCRFDFGRRLLKDYPEIFSFGMCSKKPPSEETIQNSWFQINLYGEGWKEKLANKDDQYVTPIDKRIVGKVKGRNPGYGTTCIALVLSAITILTETDKLAGNGKGGIYPPGATFFKTSLIKQLNENKVSFEVSEQQGVAP